MPPAQIIEPDTVQQNEIEKSGTMIKSPRSFSRNQLIIFALLFAVIGGYFIFHTFASEPVHGLLHPSGTLIQSNTKKGIYLIEDGKLRPVSPEAYNTNGYTYDEVRVATEADKKLPVGEPVPLAEGAIVKTGGKTFELEKSKGKIKKRLIENSQRLGQLNTNVADVTDVGKKLLPDENLPAKKTFTGKERHLNGTVILSESGKKYVIENDQRRPVPSDAIGRTNRLNIRTTTAQTEGDKTLPIGPMIEPMEGSLIKGSDQTIYVVEKVNSSLFGGVVNREKTIKRPLRSHEAFLSYGYRDSEVVKLPEAELSSLPTGGLLPESPTAPVQVIITPKKGQSTKTLSAEYVKNNGAKLRHVFSDWFSMELPLDQAEKLKTDSRIKQLEGNIPKVAYIPEAATAAFTIPQCEDGKDNDGDNLIDFGSDPGCNDWSDNDEYNSPGTPLPPDPWTPPPPPPPPPPPSGQPPVNQSDPTISGIAQVGQTLVSSNGTWANGVLYFSWQWQRCTSSQPEDYGSGCTNISGATSPNYVLTTSDVNYYVHIRITASNSYGAGLSAGSKVAKCANGLSCAVGQSTTPVPAPAPSPSPTPTPTPTPPSTLSPVIKVWEWYFGNSWVYSVDQASRCEVHLKIGIQPFTPSLGGRYTVSAGSGNEAGQLWCWNGTVGPVYSALSGPGVSTPTPTPSPSLPSPTINTWKFNYGNSWTYNVSNSSYCEVHLSNGGIQPFTPTNGYTLSVTAGSGGLSGQLKCWNGSVGPTVSAVAGPVAPAPAPAPTPTGYPPVPDQYPVISGIATVGNNLQSSSGTWRNGVTSFKYQWYRCGGVDYLGYGINCLAITGATSSVYNLVSTDQGSRMVVKLTATNSYGSASAGSLATGVVAAPSSAAQISAKPSGAVAPGTPVTLSWNMYPATSCKASSSPAITGWLNDTVKPVVGSAIVTVTATTNFIWYCANSNNFYFADITITVSASAPAPAPSPTPTPSPSNLPTANLGVVNNGATTVPSGTDVYLTWSSINANSCIAISNPQNSNWTGTLPAVAGTKWVGALTTTTTFSTYCTNGYGASPTKAVTITVTGGSTPAPTPTPTTITNFQRTSPHLARVGATSTSGGSAGNIAVLDTGVDQHPLLNIGAGINCIAGDSSAPNQDPNGHGTGVSGVIGARGDGVNSPRGIAPGTTIIPIKVASPSGSLSSDDVACGVNWAAARGYPINMSFAGSGTYNCSSAAWANAICNAARSVRTVASAGNSAADIAGFWPASLPGVIAATAINDNDGRPGGQNLGNACGQDDEPASYSNFAQGGFGNVLIAAPVCTFSPGLSGGNVRFSGTSAAAPMVIGGGARSSSDPAYMYKLPGNGREYGPLLRL